MKEAHHKQMSLTYHAYVALAVIWMSAAFNLARADDRWDFDGNKARIIAKGFEIAPVPLNISHNRELMLG